MNRDQLLAWFADLGGRVPDSAGNRFGLSQEGVAWVSEVGALLNAAFPVGHDILRSWERRTPPEANRTTRGPEAHSEFARCSGVFAAARRIFDSDRVGSLGEAIRRETEAEFIDTADALLADGYRIAAVVVAGGALEVHLRHLYARMPERQPFAPPPSIGKYNGAIAQARNLGNPTPYDQNDGQQVLAWGGERNTAAHTPDAFNMTAEQIELMLRGIRDFINRTR